MFAMQNKFRRLYSVNFVIESQCIYAIGKIVNLPPKSFVSPSARLLFWLMLKEMLAKAKLFLFCCIFTISHVFTIYPYKECSHKLLCLLGK